MTSQAMKQNTKKIIDKKEFFDKYWLPYLNNPKVSPNGKFPYEKDFVYTYRNGTTMRTAIWTEKEDTFISIMNRI